MNDKAIRVGMGLRIAMLRKTRGLSQQELATTADVSGSTVSRVEGGSQFLTLPALLRIASSLDVEPGRLMPDLEDIRTAEGT